MYFFFFLFQDLKDFKLKGSHFFDFENRKGKVFNGEEFQSGGTVLTKIVLQVLKRFPVVYGDLNK